MHLFRQLLTESFLLVIAGGFLGWTFAVPVTASCLVATGDQLATRSFSSALHPRYPGVRRFDFWTGTSAQRFVGTGRTGPEELRSRRDAGQAQVSLRTHPGSSADGDVHCAAGGCGPVAAHSAQSGNRTAGHADPRPASFRN